MPRQARESSGTGIYHVMMRGINHQNIFEEHAAICVTNLRRNQQTIAKGVFEIQTRI